MITESSKVKYEVRIDQIWKLTGMTKGRVQQQHASKYNHGNNKLICIYNNKNFICIIDERYSLFDETFRKVNGSQSRV